MKNERWSLLLLLLLLLLLSPRSTVNATSRASVRFGCQGQHPAAGCSGRAAIPADIIAEFLSLSVSLLRLAFFIYFIYTR